MKKTLFILLAVASALCAKAEEPTTNLTATVTLAWNASASTPTSGGFNYNLYVGTNPGVYFTNYAVGTNLSCTVSNLSPGNTFYFASTATDTNDGFTSAYSAEINFMPVSAPASPTGMNITIIRF